MLQRRDATLSVFWRWRPSVESFSLLCPSPPTKCCVFSFSGVHCLTNLCHSLYTNRILILWSLQIFVCWKSESGEIRRWYFWLRYLSGIWLGRVNWNGSSFRGVSCGGDDGAVTYFKHLVEFMFSEESAILYGSKTVGLWHRFQVAGNELGERYLYLRQN